MSKEEIFEKMIEEEKKNPSVYGNDEDRYTNQGLGVQMLKQTIVLIIGILIGISLIIGMKLIVVSLIILLGLFGAYIIYRLSTRTCLLKYKSDFAMKCFYELFKATTENITEDTYFGVKAIVKKWNQENP